MFHLAWQYPLVVLGSTQANQDQQDPFSLKAPFPIGVHHLLWRLPPQQAPTALRLQLLAADTAMELQNVVNLDLMSPASLGILLKSAWMWELEILQTGVYDKGSECTLTIYLGVPGLFNVLPHHLNQLTTR